MKNYEFIIKYLNCIVYAGIFHVRVCLYHQCQSVLLGMGGGMLSLCLLYHPYQLCVMRPVTMMNAESGKSQDTHTCSMTNGVSGLTLTFA